MLVKTTYTFQKETSELLEEGICFSTSIFPLKWTIVRMGGITETRKFFPLKVYPFTLILNLKTPITTAADDIHEYVFIVFQGKIRLDVSSESSARQRIYMKNQTFFSSKDKSKNVKCRLLHFCLAL